MVQFFFNSKRTVLPIFWNRSTCASRLFSLKQLVQPLLRDSLGWSCVSPWFCRLSSTVFDMLVWLPSLWLHPMMTGVLFAAASDSWCLKRLQTTHPALSLCKTQIRVLFRNAPYGSAVLRGADFISTAENSEPLICWLLVRQNHVHIVRGRWSFLTFTVSAHRKITVMVPPWALGRTMTPEKLRSFPKRESSGALPAHGASMVVKMIAAMGWWYLQWFYGLHPAIASMTGEGCCHSCWANNLESCLVRRVRRWMWGSRFTFPWNPKPRGSSSAIYGIPLARRKMNSANCFQLSRSCQRDSVKLVKETGWTWNLDPKHQKVSKELLHFGCFREESTGGLIEVGFCHHSHSVGSHQSLQRIQLTWTIWNEFFFHHRYLHIYNIWFL